jgi:twitching motility two-component system response regulator PilG
MAKILVIDDAEDTRNFVERVLGKEHEVFTVEEWTKAQDYLFEQALDLILLDINMPGFTGDQVAKIFKKGLGHKPVKIVLFSAMDEYALRQKAREVEVDGYISKTSDEKLLHIRVRRYLK